MKRACELAGPEVSGQPEKEDNVWAYLGIMGDNTLVRFFIDAGADDISDNFEIVTDKSLIVWKPVGTNQGHIYGTEGICIQSDQKYVADLENGSGIGR